MVLDVDRTIGRTLAKGEVVKNTDKVLIAEVDNINTWESWETMLANEITPEFIKQNNIKTIAVDNISELERCILSDLGSKGKNKGVPAMSDYQYMQFKLVNSLRYMKSLGVNVVWTAWEDTSDFVMPDGTSYTRLVPKISKKIVDNICGLCDVVGKIAINSESGNHGIVLKATTNILAKNQIDTREGCLVEDFVKRDKKKKEKAKKPVKEEKNNE